MILEFSKNFNLEPSYKHPIKHINISKKYFEFIYSPNNHEFDYSLKAGDAIIFNEGLVHKGSKLLHSDRMILRFHFKPIIN